MVYWCKFASVYINSNFILENWGSKDISVLIFKIDLHFKMSNANFAPFCIPLVSAQVKCII